MMHCYKERKHAAALVSDKENVVVFGVRLTPFHCHTNSWVEIVMLNQEIRQKNLWKYEKVES